MARGICKLCLMEKELQRSHLMAKSLYKKTRSGDPKQPHPLIGTKKGLKPSSHQVWDYVFCSECEQRFSKEGEDYMMRLVTSKGIFPLLEKLESGGTPVKGDFFRAYSAGESPSIDRDQIAYFAASVFWRASVHTWKQEDGTLVFVTIPSEHREVLRRYLLGLDAFPKDAALFMIVCTDSESHNMFVMPGNNVKNAGGWVVIMRGLIFIFAMGKEIPSYISKYCLVNSPNRWVIVRDCSVPHKIWQFK